MSNTHLTEEELQSYALNIPADTEAVLHVNTCNHCQAQVKAYQMLYSQIRESDTPALDFAVEELVPAYLPNMGTSEKMEYRYLYCLLFIAALPLAALIIGYWNMLSWLFSGIFTSALLLLLCGLLAMGIWELFRNYNKKINTLKPH